MLHVGMAPLTLCVAMPARRDAERPPGVPTRSVTPAFRRRASERGRTRASCPRSAWARLLDALRHLASAMGRGASPRRSDAERRNEVEPPAWCPRSAWARLLDALRHLAGAAGRGASPRRSDAERRNERIGPRAHALRGHGSLTLYVTLPARWDAERHSGVPTRSVGTRKISLSRAAWPSLPARSRPSRPRLAAGARPGTPVSASSVSPRNPARGSRAPGRSRR